MNWTTQVDPSFERVLNLLTKADKEFIPSLSSRVDIIKYAQKLSKHAINLYVVDNGRDFGHAAFYINDKLNQSAFLTSIYVPKEMRGKGLADHLLTEVICKCRSSGIKELILSVDPENYTALRFYNKFGFVVKDNKNETTMSILID